MSKNADDSINYNHQNNASHLNVNCHHKSQTKPLFPETQIVSNQNMIQIKDASTNTTNREKRNPIFNQERICRRKNKSDKGDKRRCAFCVRDKLVKTNSANNFVRTNLQTCCKLDSSNNSSVNDTLSFEIGVKKHHPNLSTESPKIRHYGTKKTLESNLSMKSSNYNEAELINEDLSKSCSLSFEDTPTSEVSFFNKEECDIDRTVLEKSTNSMSQNHIIPTCMGEQDKIDPSVNR